MPPIGAGGRVTPTRPAHQRAQVELWCPCEWVANLDEAGAYIEGQRRLCYVFFHLLGPELQGNFYRDPLMQKLSRERLVFVDMTVAKKPAPEQRAFLRRCRVTAVPYAVISDAYGNPLFLGASTRDANELYAQALAAERTEKRRNDTLALALDEAKKRCREERWLKAASALVEARRENLVGLPILGTMEQLFSEINAHLEARLAQILAAEKNPTRRRELLRALQSQTHEDLPVYARIAEALKAR